MREKELKKRAERGENDVKGKEKRFEHWQIIAAYLVIYDIFAVNFSYFLGLLLRFVVFYHKYRGQGENEKVPKDQKRDWDEKSPI